ncbi:alpha/beta hydrolase family protein [Streptomyces sp. NPDC018019]|uniref:alpha/beta hydrolase family protein n=1 Tax=Streptomyces sp. NPDC018019 TaxID=3365030 RepID=UPI00378E23EE
MADTRVTSRPATGAPRPGRGTAPRLELPPPTGPRAVGVRTVHLVDDDREDPFRPGRPRELMAQLWYPARAGTGAVPGRYVSAAMSPLVVGAWEDWWAEERGCSGLPRGTAAGVAVHGAADAPPAPDARGCPLVLLSPGHAQYRAALTALGEDLASRGFLVAALDHPSDALGVEFPDGRIVPYREPDGLADGDTGDLATRYVPVRAADLRFARTRLTAPGFWWHALLDPSRAGVAGHSLGGAAAAEAMRLDPGLAAGADLDGTPYGEVLRTGLERPFLICQFTADDPEYPEEPRARERLWRGLRGPRHHLLVTGGGHESATDLDALAGPLGFRECTDPGDYADALGSLPEGRGVEITRACVGAFFERYLSGAEGTWCDTGAPPFPEVTAVG